jgi:mannose-1-phosphate guanylyltransferase / mannose-6-phosphate isomerase
VKIVILAGGKGTRLWPLSQNGCPKPFLRLGGPYSFLQKTLLRFLSSYGARSLAVVTSDFCLDYVKEQCLELDPEGKIAILTEGRNLGTAPSFARSLCLLQEKKWIEADEVVLVSPSDGLISPLEGFYEALTAAKEAAKQGALVVLGVTPKRAESSYGYIELGKKQGGLFSCKQFVEKPSYDKACDMLKKGNFLWNTGHLLTTPKTFWKEAKLHHGKIASLQGLSSLEVEEKIAFFPEISLDTALLEKSQNVLTYKMKIDWSDIGSWDSIYDTFKKDERGNVEMGDVVSIDANNCLFIGEKGSSIAAVGVEDLLVVQTQEGLFIGKKGRSQQLKDLVEQMQKAKENMVPK